MRKKITKLTTLLFVGLSIVFNLNAQDATFNSFPTGWTTSSVNAGLENECKLSIATATVSGNTTYLSATTSPSYILVSLPNATTTTIDKVAIEVLANNTTAGKYGICAFSTDNLTYVNGATFLLPINSGATSTYTYTAPSNAKYFKAGRDGSGVTLGGATISSGSATVRFYSIKVWLKSITPTITSFSAAGISATIDQTAKTITAVLPYGTNLTSITPAVTIGGSATSYTPTGAQDFSSAVTYHVPDGTKTVDYSVTLTVPATPPAPTITLASGSTNQTLKAGNTITDIVYNLINVSSTGATVTGLPNGVTGTFTSTGTNTGTYTISGIPSEETSYPTTHSFTITASPISGYSGSDVNSTGSITVVNPALKSIAYIVNSTLASNDTQIKPMLDNNYFVTVVPIANITTSPSYDFSAYDLVVLTEAPSTSTNTNNIISLWGINKPMLSLKMFAAKSTIWNMGTPNNPTTAATTNLIFEPNHPIFAGITTSGTYNNEIAMLSAISSGNGLQYTTYSNNYLLGGTAKSQSVIVEFPIGTSCSVSGTTNATSQKKTVIIGIANDNQNLVTADAKTMIKNACDYLLGTTSWGTDAGTQFKDTQVTGTSSANVTSNSATISWSKLPVAVSYTISSSSGSYAVKGNKVIAATTDVSVDGANTSYNLTGLTENTDYTFNIVGLNANGTSSSVGIVTFKTPAVVTSISPTLINGVTFDGKNILNSQKVNLNVFDLSGRFIINSNQDISMSNKAKGIYIIKADNGVMKIAVR